MTFLSVFHQQECILNFTAKYDIDREERVKVDDEHGSCISDNYNLF